jgi:hypothetical protein
MVTLEPPRFTKGQFPLKIPGPAGQTRLKNGRDAVLIKKKKHFIGQFIKLTREFDSIRSRSANIVTITY